MCIWYIILTGYRNTSLKNTKKHFQQNQDFTKSAKFSFYQNFFQKKNQSIEIKKSYQVFYSFYEDEKYMFLALDQNQTYILPKEYFTPKQIEFIKSKIKTKNYFSKN